MMPCNVNVNCVVLSKQQSKTRIYSVYELEQQKANANSEHLTAGNNNDIFSVFAGKISRHGRLLAVIKGDLLSK